MDPERLCVEAGEAEHSSPDDIWVLTDLKNEEEKKGTKWYINQPVDGDMGSG